MSEQVKCRHCGMMGEYLDGKLVTEYGQYCPERSSPLGPMLHEPSKRPTPEPAASKETR